jgi:hypothetical protein
MTKETTDVQATYLGRSLLGKPLAAGSPLFVGRDGLLSALKSHVMRDDNLVVLTGAAKVGKTSLVNQLANTFAREASVVEINARQIFEHAIMRRWLTDLTGQVNKKVVLAVDDAELLGGPGGIQKLYSVWALLRDTLGEFPFSIVLVGDVSLARTMLNQPVFGDRTHFELHDLQLADVQVLVKRIVAGQTESVETDSWSKFGHNPTSSLASEMVLGILCDDLMAVTHGNPLFVQHYCSTINLSEEYLVNQEQYSGRTPEYFLAMQNASLQYLERLHAILSQRQIEALRAVAKFGEGMAELPRDERIQLVTSHYVADEGAGHRVTIPAFSEWLCRTNSLEPNQG